jgi:2-phosphosulfolactate phosphatase
VIAAGERLVHANDLTRSLRPAMEDLIGAGAILAALDAARPSPEALAAMAAWRAVEPDPAQFLYTCASGRDLCERDFAQDVDLAAQFDVSHVTPFFDCGALRAWNA